MFRRLPIGLFAAGFTTLSGCSGRSSNLQQCSSLKAEAYARSRSADVLSSQLQNRDAAGGELIVEFRKDSLLGAPTHQKKCTFFLEPARAAKTGGYFWTAGHCLDPSRDSSYRLRFYIDIDTGYQEIPIHVDQISRLNNLRDILARQLSPTAQVEVLSALKEKDVDFSGSANATDICLNSVRSGQTFFHKPISGANQISCFLYQDLRIVEFKVPESLDATQKQVLNFALQRAQAFENSLPIPPDALIRKDTREETMSSFRLAWVNAYRTYTGFRENDGFKDWIDKSKQKCADPTAAQGSEICSKYKEIRNAFSQAGLAAQADIFDANLALQEPVDCLLPQETLGWQSRYECAKREIANLWVFYRQAEALIGETTKRPYDYFDLLSNYAWNSGSLKSFSVIGIGGFWGLGWGTHTDSAGNTRDRVGAATYDWNTQKNEKFFYTILPKEQTYTNFQLGFGQLRLHPGDSGSMILAGGLPLGVLSTVDGEKTSGGSSVLALPIGVEEQEVEASTQRDTTVKTQPNPTAPKQAVTNCLH